MFDISFLGKPIAWAWRVGGHLRIYKDMQELASFNVSNVPAIQTPIGFVFSPDLDAAELRYNLADGVEVYESKWAKTLLDNPHNQLCVLFERGLLVSWKEQLPATISLDALTQITHKCYRTSVRETHWTQLVQATTNGIAVDLTKTAQAVGIEPGTPLYLHSKGFNVFITPNEHSGELLPAAWNPNFRLQHPVIEAQARFYGSVQIVAVTNYGWMLRLTHRNGERATQNVVDQLPDFGDAEIHGTWPVQVRLQRGTIPYIELASCALMAAGWKVNQPLSIEFVPNGIRLRAAESGNQKIRSIKGMSLAFRLGASAASWLGNPQEVECFAADGEVFVTTAGLPHTFPRLEKQKNFESGRMSWKLQRQPRAPVVIGSDILKQTYFGRDGAFDVSVSPTYLTLTSNPNGNYRLTDEGHIEFDEDMSGMFLDALIIQRVARGKLQLPYSMRESIRHNL